MMNDDVTPFVNSLSEGQSRGMGGIAQGQSAGLVIVRSLVRSLQERRESFSPVEFDSRLTFISLSVPPPCYRS